MAANDTIPRHVAIIMDGNGRWARKRALPRHAGHRSGVGAVRQTVELAAKRGVEFLTLIAFSSENWSRPRDEVSKLMGLFVEALQREANELHRSNVRLEFIGAREQLQAGLIDKIAAVEAQTSGNTGLRLTVAVAYGGRWDIVRAVQQLAGRVAAGEMSVDEIDDQAVAAELALRNVPDPDLLIRTGGEQRISNFLLWDMAYSELYFTDTLWPQFDSADLDEALSFYSMRQRRFGKTGEQVATRA